MQDVDGESEGDSFFLNVQLDSLCTGLLLHGSHGTS